MRLVALKSYVDKLFASSRKTNHKSFTGLDHSIVFFVKSLPVHSWEVKSVLHN
jgi:hypothetical protein